MAYTLQLFIMRNTILLPRGGSYILLYLSINDRKIYVDRRTVIHTVERLQGFNKTQSTIKGKNNK